MFENAATAEAAHELTGEGHQITYHGKPIEIKDRLNRFRPVDDHIWNNPYRATC